MGLVCRIHIAGPERIFPPALGVLCVRKHHARREVAESLALRLSPGDLGARYEKTFI